MDSQGACRLLRALHALNVLEASNSTESAPDAAARQRCAHTGEFRNVPSPFLEDTNLESDRVLEVIVGWRSGT